MMRLFDNDKLKYNIPSYLVLKNQHTMKIVRYLIFGLLAASTWLACNPEDRKAHRTTNTEVTEAPKEAPVKIKNGPVDFFDDHGKLYRTVHYVNDRMDGPAIEYYPLTGNKRLEGYYKAGLKHGRFVWYHTTGQKYQATQYENNKIHGWDSTFYKSGNPKTAVPYDGGHVVEGTAEWDMYKKKTGAPTIRLETSRRDKNLGTGFTLTASFTEKVNNPHFEIGVIGNGTKMDPATGFEAMMMEKAGMEEAWFWIPVQAGYEWAAQVVIKGKGKTQNGSPFLTYQVFPVVLR
jgi:hypothetical protein